MDSSPKTLLASLNDITASGAKDECATDIRQSVDDRVPNSGIHSHGLSYFNFGGFDTVVGFKIDADIQAHQVSQVREAQEGFNFGEAHDQPTSPVTSSMGDSPLHDITYFKSIGPGIGLTPFPLPDARYEDAKYPNEVNLGSSIFINPLFQPDIGEPDAFATVDEYVDVSTKPSITASLLPPDLQGQTIQTGSTYGTLGDEQRDLDGRHVARQYDHCSSVPYARVHPGIEKDLETLGAAQSAGMPSSTQLMSREDALANAGYQSEASPISESRWNNDSIRYPASLEYRLQTSSRRSENWDSKALCPSQNNAHHTILPPPIPRTALAGVDDAVPLNPRRIKKQAADRDRNKAREIAKRNIKVLFPKCKTSNDALRTAINVIRYLMANTVIPPSMHVIDEWCKAENFYFLVPPTADTTTPSASSSNETNGPSDEQEERKARKKAMDKARNAEEQALTKMLVGMFRDSGGDTVVKALDLASDYLVYARQMGKGMLPIASPEWHDAYDKYQQAKSRFFASG